MNSSLAENMDVIAVPATTPSMEAEIIRLSKLDPINYETERKPVAKALGLEPGRLDKLVNSKKSKDTPTEENTKGQGREIQYHDPEPWPDPVDGAQLLNEIAAVLTDHVVLPDHAAPAVALWIVHTYVFHKFDTTPRLAILSPEPRCGKSRLQDTIALMVNRPEQTANITAAPLFRVIELHRPTLLIDEVDSFLRQDDEMRGILNSGHGQNGAVTRCVGEDNVPSRFSTFAPVAMGGIGKLPATLMDRSIVIRMRRKLPGERVGRLNRHAPDFRRLPRQIVRWISDMSNDLETANPDIPTELSDRQADGWRPLMALADLAGRAWPSTARTSAIALSGEGNADTESIGVQLLADIKGILDRHGDKVSSIDICRDLNEMEDRPWPEWKGRPITVRQLAALLGKFGINPGTTRDGSRTFKGYRLDQFEDAFRRYLPLSNPSHRHNPSNPPLVTEYEASHSKSCDGSKFRHNPHDSALCDGATDRKGGEGRFPESGGLEARI